MTQLTADRTALIRRRPAGSVSPLARLGVWMHNWRSRRALSRLSDEQLMDVGLTPAEAAKEIRLPFWIS